MDALGVSVTCEFLKTVKTEPPAQRQKGVIVKDVAELVDVLKKKGFDLMNKVLIVGEHDGKSLESRHGEVRYLREQPFRIRTVTIVGARLRYRRGCHAGGRASPASRPCCAVDRAGEPAPAGRHSSRRKSSPWPPTTAHVFGPSTSFGKDLMPRVAALSWASPKSATSWPWNRHSVPVPPSDLRRQCHYHGRSRRLAQETRRDRTCGLLRSGCRRR